MNRLFGFGKEISYLSRLSNKIFFSLVVIILTFNIFVNFTLNINKKISENLSDSFVIVDLQKDLKQEQKNDLEKYLLKLNGVKSTRFMDRMESFKKLQDDLNISIPKSTNPLYDSIIVNLKNGADINKIQEIIETKEEVKEVYKDETYINSTGDKSLNWGIIQISGAVLASLLGLVSILIFNLGVGLEFLNNINLNEEYKESIAKSKLRKLLPYTAASIIGTLIFFNLYILCRKYGILLEYNYIMLSFKEIFIWHIVAVAFLNFLVWVLPVNILKIDGGEDD